jgi:uncharacterized protein
MLEFKTVKIRKPDEVNIILGQSHFIKTVEDICEVMITGVPGIKFGMAFTESSGACKIRSEGTDPELKKIAQDNALEINCGHAFIIALRDAYPINVLNAVKAVPEVCTVFCASANPVEVVVAETEQGRGIMGVIDGLKAKGVENKEDIAWRRDFLRKIGYKL